MAVFAHGVRATAHRIAELSPLLERLLVHLSRFRRAYLSSQEQHGRLLLGIQILYACLFGGWFVYSKTWPAVDVVALFLLVFAFLAARGLSFLRDWSPFVLLLIGYVALTGIAGGLAEHVHVGFPINADGWMFFHRIPTEFLQAHLWHPGHPQWYDYVSSALYLLHFVIPLVVAFVFWMSNKPLYWKFVASYLLLSYAGFVTYLLYPMAPPWWAAQHGQIPPITDILAQVRFGDVSNPIVLATRYFRPNPVAAMPSIHAAFPVLVWLVLWKRWPAWGWATVIYPLAMGFAVVYLGQHYVVDVLAGWMYAVVAFYLIWGGRRTAAIREVRPKRLMPSSTLATAAIQSTRAGYRKDSAR